MTISQAFNRPVANDDYTLMLMYELDKQYTATHFYGVLKMTEHLHCVWTLPPQEQLSTQAQLI